MNKLTKEEKKALQAKYTASVSKEYVLTQEQVEELFAFLESQLEETPCDHTLQFTTQWLEENLNPSEIEAVLAEINEMGGYCDCEVLMNCYEDYDIE